MIFQVYPASLQDTSKGKYVTLRIYGIFQVIITFSSLELTNDPDTTSIEALHDFYVYLQQQGKHLILARLKDPVHGILQSSWEKEFSELPMTRLSVERAVGSWEGCRKNE